MNLMLFGLILTVLSFFSAYQVENTLYFIDILPDFIGYLILWVTLEKRRINKELKVLYTAVSVMTLISFLLFLGQIKVFFESFLFGNLTFIRLLLDGFSFLSGNFAEVFLLIAVLLLGWLHLGMLRYWERDNTHKLHCTVCKVGMGLCIGAALCHLGACFIILPFSWHWIAYPLSLLAVAAAWYVMKDSQEMLTGTSEPVKERLFGGKK